MKWKGGTTRNMSTTDFTPSANSCRDAIREAFDSSQGPLTAAEVRERVARLYPTRWSPGSVTADLTGSTVNLPSSRHYPTARRYAFLFRQDDGRYRLWNRATDGNWRVTATGVELVDADDPGVDGTLADESNAERLEAASLDSISSGALSLERDLESCLLSCISQLEPGLRLYSGENAQYQQLDTGVAGRLDLLATDDCGRLVVIELKAGMADDRVCGQILRYMGWVKVALATPGQEIRGIIVAHDFTDGLRYAVEAMRQVRLKRYSISFQFEDPSPIAKSE